MILLGNKCKISIKNFFWIRGSQKGGGSDVWEKFPNNIVFFLWERTLCIIHCISKRDTDYCLPVDLALQLVPRPPHTGGAERQRAAWAPLQLQHWYQALHTNLMLYTFDLDLEGVCFSWILTIFFSLFGPTTMGSSKNRSSPFCWYSKLFLYTRQHCFGRVNQILLDCNISFWVRTITPP